MKKRFFYGVLLVLFLPLAGSAQSLKKTEKQLREYVYTLAGSDHSPFYDRGIPAFMLMTGIHPDYHPFPDTPDKINYNGMALIYQYAKEIVEGLSTDALPVTFQKANP